MTQLGATLNFGSGFIAKAPNIFWRFAFEWLWRIKEESLLWCRYGHDGTAFLKVFLTRALRLLVSMGWRRFVNHGDDTISVSALETPREIVIRLRGAAIEKNIEQATSRFRCALDRDCDVLLNLAEVEVIDSRFLGVILMLRRELAHRGRILRLSDVSDRASRVLRLGGFEFLLEQPSVSKQDAAASQS